MFAAILVAQDDDNSHVQCILGLATFRRLPRVWSFMGVVANFIAEDQYLQRHLLMTPGSFATQERTFLGRVMECLQFG